jgi:hypothetical protein
VVSAYFVCAFAGNALPVIGIAVLATLIGSIAAVVAFAAMISVFSLTALGFGLRIAR